MPWSRLFIVTVFSRRFRTCPNKVFPDQTLKECFSSSQMQPFLPDDLMVEPNFAEWEVKFSCVDVSLSKNVMQMELLWTFFFLMFSRGKR